MRSDIALLAVDSAYQKLGITGCTYQPLSGDPVTGLTCMLTMPDVDIGFERNVAVAEIEVRVRAGEVTPAEGGRFTIGGRTYKVLGVPTSRDSLRLEWQCAVKDVT